MNILCVTNNKGGVAKTTSTVDLAYAIADKGYKVLVVDTDPQCNSTYSLLGSELAGFPSLSKPPL
jgi:chromosome partitioning protein